MVKMYRMCFDIIDVDQGGSIDTDELRHGLQLIKIYPSDEELRDMMQAAELDDEGDLSFPSFVKLMVSLSQGQSIDPENAKKPLESSPSYNFLPSDGSATAVGVSLPCDRAVSLQLFHAAFVACEAKLTPIPATQYYVFLSLVPPTQPTVDFAGNPVPQLRGEKNSSPGKEETDDTKEETAVDMAGKSPYVVTESEAEG